MQRRAKFGIGVGRLIKGMSFGESWQILADLSLQCKPTGAASDKPEA